MTIPADLDPATNTKTLTTTTTPQLRQTRNIQTTQTVTVQTMTLSIPTTPQETKTLKPTQTTKQQIQTHHIIQQTPNPYLQIHQTTKNQKTTQIQQLMINIIPQTQTTTPTIHLITIPNQKTPTQPTLPKQKKERKKRKKITT